jgi:hypothetical protein
MYIRATVSKPNQMIIGNKLLIFFNPIIFFKFIFKYTLTFIIVYLSPISTGLYKEKLIAHFL